MGPGGVRTTQKVSKVNGLLKTILASVGGCLLAAAVVYMVNHFMNHGIHQDKEDKKNQTLVWFSQWWEEKFQRDVRPQFDEIKAIIRDQCTHTDK